MSGSETALALLWVAIGIVAGFFVWTYVSSMLPAASPA